MKSRNAIRALAFGVASAAVLSSLPALSASHREAPMIAMDPSADITDVYAFVSYDEDNLERGPADRRVTLIMNVIPGQEPGDGPNYFSFADDVAYRLHVDNNADGIAEDIVYEFTFATEDRPALGGVLDSPVPFLGNPNIAVEDLSGIVALDGDGSEGLTRRQTYTVTEWRDGIATPLFDGQTLVSVPSNVGPATMPDYEDLASQGVYSDGDMRVFTGQRAETFYIDLGAVFDTVNLRRPLPALSVAEDAPDFVGDDGRLDPFGVNRFSGFNINTIAIELPIAALTADGLAADATAEPVLGFYASTSRQKTKKYLEDGTVRNSGPWVQVSRMANPLVNELIIDTPFKDRWNAAEPEDEAQFESFFQNPTLATALGLIFDVPIADAPRTDLMEVFLKYPGQAVAPDGSCGSPCAELLRLDITIDPTEAESQDRLGAVVGSDPAGFPNGRRPNDDVTDIATRVLGGDVYIAARVGDGVNALPDAPGAGVDDGTGYGNLVGNRLDVTERGIAKEFPFLPTPHDGRDRQHIDCDEEGANACDEPVI